LKKLNFRKLLKFILCLITLTLFADLSYSIYVRFKLKRFENHVERDSDGYLLGSAPIEAGTGENAILFVHGFNDSPALWKTWVPFFAKNGFYCKAIRLPNTSLSLLEKKDATIDNRMDYIKAEFDNLKKDYNKVVLCSHSMSGAYSIALTGSGQVQPDVLVMIAPMFGISSKKSPILSPEQWLKIGAKITIFTDSVKNIMTMDVHDKSVIPDYPTHPFIPFSLYDTLFNLIDMCADSAKDIKVPTIFMVVEQDTVVDVDSQKIFFDDIASTNKVMLVDKNSGHVIPRDFDNQVQATILLENINKFLKIN